MLLRLPLLLRLLGALLFPLLPLPLLLWFLCALLFLLLLLLRLLPLPLLPGRLSALLRLAASPLLFRLAALFVPLLLLPVNLDCSRK